MATAEANDELETRLDHFGVAALAIADERNELIRALKSAMGHMLNAKIDLETGTKKATTLATLEGGLRIVRGALAKVGAI